MKKMSEFEKELHDLNQSLYPKIDFFSDKVVAYPAAVKEQFQEKLKKIDDFCEANDYFIGEFINLEECGTCKVCLEQNIGTKNLEFINLDTCQEGYYGVDGFEFINCGQKYSRVFENKESTGPVLASDTKRGIYIADGFLNYVCISQLFLKENRDKLSDILSEMIQKNDWTSEDDLQNNWTEINNQIKQYFINGQESKIYDQRQDGNTGIRSKFY
ncbi:hypothetical protein [Mesoplasma lactucae]|uniref:Uncharacterized protein n=1 Tax=Mesoplasma lactucae ATCC 49193 TaxID=81460 RepID=A0A291IRP4_9MOLU|nr:hypothetical protein [Mesoplasma lactucae]ATG97386.1 hypothetical protein CP520_01260 [Mesoplasma lactucae ATCC 49193]ATZ20161.1 hypothetical protein MLACT_v1c03400 [Mesoplasma lactucae ATCC 49193]MCL8216910.1 hypothetical protein [Mesoplasma lactucae ATCC 49193]